FRFLHDRIREAAYAMTAPERRAEIHLAIGRRLAKTTPAGERGEHAIEIASLDLEAALRAKRSTAYKAATTFLAAAVECLPRDAWQSHAELAFAIHKE